MNFYHLLQIGDYGAEAPLLHFAGLRMPLRASRWEEAAVRALLPRDRIGAFRTGGEQS